MKKKKTKNENYLFNPKYSLKKNYKVFTTIFIAGLFLTTTLVSVGFAALNQNLQIAGQLEYEKMNVWAENLSYDNTNTGVDCSTAQCMLDCLADSSLCPSSAPQISFAVGDYFSMTPSTSSYSIPTSATGYSSAQTITPNQLTLWRVIKVNGNGTVEAVSEYTSSQLVYFKGRTGYQYFVNTLQTIASQYANSTYTSATRMIGFDNQTLITNNINFPLYHHLPLSETPSPTSGIGEEFEGGIGGDTLYLKDYLAVKNVYGNLQAKKVGTSTISQYWLASRYYYYDNTEESVEGRRINTSGGLNTGYLSYDNDDEGTVDAAQSAYIRPIITLKSSVTISGGSGTSASPYTLSS